MPVQRALFCLYFYYTLSVKEVVGAKYRRRELYPRTILEYIEEFSTGVRFPIFVSISWKKVAAGV